MKIPGCSFIYVMCVTFVANAAFTTAATFEPTWWFNETFVMTSTAVPLTTTTTLPPPSSNGSQAKYVFVAPLTVRPGELYGVGATIFNATAAVQLTVSLQASNFSVQNQSTLNPDSTNTITLQVPSSLTETSLSLTISANGGLTIYESLTVGVATKTVSLLVQTDKTVYNPGETVLFRVIAVLPDLKPYTQDVNVVIKDAKNNAIVQWLGKRSPLGLFNSSLVLSTQPTLGKWSIVCTAQRHSYTKQFTVEIYKPAAIKIDTVLPSVYYVNLQNINQQLNLPISISARSLASGLTVNGQVRVNISLRHDYEWTDYYLNTLKTRSGNNEILLDLPMSNGLLDTTVLATDLRDITPVVSNSVNDLNALWASMASRRLRVFVTVNDTAAKDVVTVDSTVECSQWSAAYDYSFRFVDNTTKIVKPGIPVKLTLQLKRNDGKALSSIDFAGSSVSSVTFTSNCYDSGRLQRNVSYTASMTLSGLLDYSLPSQCALHGPVTAKMTVGGSAGTSVTTANWTPTQFTSRDDAGIALLLLSSPDGITSGSVVSFRVLTSNDSTSLSYQLIGKGVVLKSQTLSFSASKSHDFSITIDSVIAPKLRPKARLLVWYSTVFGEIISESIDFTVNGAFTNQVTAAYSTTSNVQSGDSVTVNIDSVAGSFVGLLAVDQTAVLAPGYDITQESILQDLFQFQTSNTCPNFAGVQSGGDSSSAVFTMAGVMAVTDGYVYPYHYCSGWSSGSPSTNYSSILKSYLDTWLWTDLTVASNGRAALLAATPQRPATWLLTAFSISATSGLAVTSQPVNITAVRQFFLALRAPYSVVKSEEFGVQATAFNYLDTAVEVTVTLQQSDHFLVRTPSNNNPHNTSVSLKFSLPPRGSGSVDFWIVPRKLGLMPVYVRGVTQMNTFLATAYVLIVPEGIPHEYSESVLVNPPSGSTVFNHIFNVSLSDPKNVIPDSLQINISISGDPLGPTLDGLGNLLQMPYGCGEQTMISLSPNVYVLKYLKAVNKLTPDIESRARYYINSGYQRELTFQRYDGSISAFGNWDSSGSVWLTAFVTKVFHEARESIPLDEHKMAEMINWILGYQNPDGSFREPGTVIHWDMQGAAAKGESLTAYVMISLLENLDNTAIEALNGSNIQSKIDMAESYLETKLSSLSDNPYALSIICYALQLSQSAQKDSCLTSLNKLAINDTANGMLYWKKSLSACYYCWAIPLDVEITGYALLTYVKRGTSADIKIAQSISKWIISQRSSSGGFISTQDTVVALQALAEYAASATGGGSSGSLDISLTAGSIAYSFIPLTADNALIVQRFQILSPVTSIAIRATGGGVFGIVQMTVRYYSLMSYSSRRRRQASAAVGSISARTSQVAVNDKEIILQACASYAPNTQPISGMCLMEISMPSGYAPVDASQLMGQARGNVKNVEQNENTNGLALYLDKLELSESCVNMTLNRYLAVSNGQPAVLTAYLYYNPDVKAVIEFKSIVDTGTTWCDQCPSCCACEAPNYFTCDSTACHAVTQKCDGVAHCLDGKDEIGCFKSGGHRVDVIQSTVLMLGAVVLCRLTATFHF